MFMRDFSKSMLLVSASILTMMSAMPALAQGTTDTMETVVVTGTLIRGAAPIGSQVLSISADKAVETGATSTDQLLSSLPQIGNFFNGVPISTATTGNAAQVNRPNLRGLQTGFSSGATTLILMDGHRLTDAGSTQAAVDPDVIPAAAIARVEVMPDGGSATYGTDAVGGVINFITKRTFDGVRVNGRAGFANNYQTYDASIIAGTDWSTGGVYVSLSHTEHSPLFNRDRNYMRRLDYSTTPPVPTGTACELPNDVVSATTVSFVPVPHLVTTTTNYGMTSHSAFGSAGTLNRCDLFHDYATAQPSERRDSIFLGASQDFGDAISFDLRGFFTRRATVSDDGPFTGQIQVSPSNPYYIAPASGISPAATQTVNFSFGPALGYHSSVSRMYLQEWNITPTATVRLGDNWFGKDWELDLLGNFGASDTTYHNAGLDSTKLTPLGTGTTPATALDVWNIANPANQAVLANLTSVPYYGIFNEGRHSLVNFRSTVQGTVVSLPGGDVKVAFGGEYIRNQFRQKVINGTTVSAALARAFSIYKREVWSAFGEVDVPVIGEANALPMVQELSLVVQARYDSYSDFGETVNPKFGLTYKPVDWVKFRANWGKSFNAPTPVDELASTNSTLLIFPFGLFQPPSPPFTADPPGAGQSTVILQGAHAGLKPQTGQTWSVGVDLSPSFVPGLQLGVGYWDIFFKGLLGKPDVLNTLNLFTLFPTAVTLHPSAAQITALVSNAPGGTTTAASYISNPSTVYELIDFSMQNLGNQRRNGLDFSASYAQEVSFGSIDASIAGSQVLTDRQSVSPTAPYVDAILFNSGTFVLSTSVGANIGNLRAQLIWNHSGGYNVQRTTQLPQDAVSDFNVVNAFFKYDMKGNDWATRDLSFTLNINNLFDKDPPIFKSSGGNGYTNGFTFGRMFIIGVQKDL